MTSLAKFHQWHHLQFLAAGLHICNRDPLHPVWTGRHCLVIPGDVTGQIWSITLQWDCWLSVYITAAGDLSFSVGSAVWERSHHGWCWLYFAKWQISKFITGNPGWPNLVNDSPELSVLFRTQSAMFGGGMYLFPQIWTTTLLNPPGLGGWRLPIHRSQVILVKSHVTRSGRPSQLHCEKPAESVIMSVLKTAG